MNVNQPFDVLFPGGFVQGNSIKTGAQPLIRLQISPSERFPIDINSASGIIAFDVTPTADDVNVEIKYNLQV